MTAPYTGGCACGRAEEDSDRRELCAVRDVGHHGEGQYFSD